MNGRSAGATAYRYLTRQPGVRSGHAIIEGTCVGIHDVVGLLQNGETGQQAEEFAGKLLALAVETSNLPPDLSLHRV